MRLRLLASAVLVGLIVSLSWAQGADSRDKVGETKTTPTLVVRLASLDQLKSDGLYLAELAGKEEQARQYEGLYKAFIGDKGIEGIDTKRPLGLYARLIPGLVESSFALMVPITDGQALLDYLQKLGYKGEKDKQGIYKVENIPNIPAPLYYRLANKYLYVTMAQSPENLTDKRLLPPEAVLAGNAASVVSLTVNLDQVPEQIRDMVLGQVGLRLGARKTEKRPNETDAQRQLRRAAIDEAADQLKTVLNEGQKLQLGFSIDRKANNLSLSAGLTVKPGSSLAETFAGLARQTSIGASLIGEGSAASLLLHLALPEKLRPALAAVVDEGFAHVLEKHPENERTVLEPLLKSLLPTIKMAEIDAGVSLRGPGKNDKYTILLGAKIKNGSAIEKTFKDALQAVPPKKRGEVAIDVDKAAGVNIHKIEPHKMDKGFEAAFGKGPIYFALRKDALLATAGERALDTLKEALSVEPKEGKVVQLELAAGSLAALLARDNKGIPEAARKAFEDRGSDRIRVVFSADKGLQFQATMKGQIIRFLALAEASKKKEP